MITHNDAKKKMITSEQSIFFASTTDYIFLGSHDTGKSYPIGTRRSVSIPANIEW